MNGTLHQAVALEAAQSLRQHFLRNPSDLSLQRSVTHRSARQNLNNESGPFVSNSVQHKSGRTLRIQNGRGRRGYSHAPV